MNSKHQPHRCRRSHTALGQPKAWAIGEVRDGQLAASLLGGLGIDDAIARITRINGTPEVRAYLTDALGSAIALARQNQSVETGYAYSPYGQTRKAGVAD